MSSDSDNELCFKSGRELARMIRAREASSVEVMSAFINQIERVNPQVNAICTFIGADRAIEAIALWPGRRGHLVQCEINGTRFGSCMVPRLRKFWLLIDDEVQKHIGASIGDTVAVVVEPIDPNSDAK